MLIFSLLSFEREREGGEADGQIQTESNKERLRKQSSTGIYLPPLSHMHAQAKRKHGEFTPPPPIAKPRDSPTYQVKDKTASHEARVVIQLQMKTCFI